MEVPTVFVSRKAARKQKRTVKKLQKAAYFRRESVEAYMKNALLSKGKKAKRKRKNRVAENSKPEEHDDVDVDVDDEDDDMLSEAPQPKKKAQRSKSRNDDADLTYEQYLEDVKNMSQNRLIGSMQDKEDDRAIHTYSRLLGVGKKRTGKHASEDDGLDMLLDFCDSGDRTKLDDYFFNSALDGVDKDNATDKKGKKLSKTEDSDVEDDDSEDDENEIEYEDEENGEDSAGDEEENEFEDEEEEEVEENDDDQDEDEDDEDDVVEELDDSEYSDEDEEEAEEMIAPTKKSKKVDTTSTKNKNAKEDVGGDEKKGKNEQEDIYGRKVNKQGSLIDFDPLAAQKKLLELEATMPVEQRLKMEKTIVSIVNKVSDATLIKSRVSLLEVWNTCSKNEVKKILTNILLKMISAPYRLPDVMLIAYGMFINLIHSTISTEISAHMAEVIICDYIKCIQGPKILDDKSLDNKTVLLSFLIYFKILKPEFILDVLDHISKEITEETLHHSVLFATYVYAIAKKTSFVSFFQKLEQIYNSYEQSSVTEHSRARFIAEQIATLKKNGPTSINLAMFDNQNKLLRGLYKQHKFEAATPLAMTINDLLHADETGRWWIVGSAYRLPEDGLKGTSKKDEKPTYSEEILLAASKARMNTTVRKNVFCAISSAETLDEAVGNVLQLKLKGPQEREIINVVIYMMLAGKQYNAFYFSLVESLCESNKRHQVTLKFAIWDKLKDIANMNDRKKDNLMKFITDVIRGEVLPITVLKIVDWVQMTVSMANILKGIISSLEKCGESKLNRILLPLTKKQCDADFTDGFRIFLEQMNMRDSKTFQKSIRLLDNSSYF